MKKAIILGVGALALCGVSAGVGLWLVGGSDEPVAGASGAPGEPAAALPEKTYYYSMQPEFVVNLASPSRERFLMIEMSVATHDEAHVEMLETHMPELRNELLTLLGGRQSAELATGAGKRELRDDVRTRVDALLQKHGDVAPVADVFLTRFVMQ